MLELLLFLPYPSLPLCQGSQACYRQAACCSCLTACTFGCPTASDPNAASTGRDNWKLPLRIHNFAGSSCSCLKPSYWLWVYVAWNLLGLLGHVAV